jgi:3',5'-cyclic AMP phosphodiesterase CpdA
MNSRIAETPIHSLPVAKAASRFSAVPAAAMALAAVLMAGCGTLTERASAPLATFLQINDLHVQAEPEQKGYERANAKARWLLEAAASDRHFARLDFVVGVGDLVHGGRLEALEPDLRQFREMLQALPVPFYPVAGNHEVVQQEGNPRHERAYRETFGNDRVNYAFTHAGLRFIALNNSGAGIVGPAIRQARNEWLRGELERSPGVPTIILCHIPLIPLREEAVLANSLGFRSYCDPDGETLKIVEAHADSVKAVLSGHLHLTGAVRRKGIWHVSIAGTASYPCDCALYTVFPDRIEVQVRQLPADLVTPGTNIHGRRRHTAKLEC